MIKRLLVANRGEIAVRVIRTCHELGIESVAVYSTADQDSLHVRLADRAVCIGPPSPAASYLNQGALIAAAKATGADAIHPGYGFLAENAEFADLCAAYDITWVGPPGEIIRRMGDKAAARRAAVEAGVPIIQGSESVLATPEEALRIARCIGYPVLLKAAAGGGGRGMRRVGAEAELEHAFRQAQTEAQAAFGDGGLYLEQYLPRVRHVEVQIIGDRYGNVIHLGERDCTVQRRHQKLVEEAPAPELSRAMREQMANAAVALAKNMGYIGVGTVEFVLDRDSGKFYFIEMNTRIQVEHPVTELVTGVDIVAEQIRVAAGQPLSITQTDVQWRGHAIECRINAEEPNDNFRPCPGQLTRFVVPGGFGVRVDTHCYPGYSVPPFYDSLLAKLVVVAQDRTQAIARMRRALGEFMIGGVATTVSFHRRLLTHPDFVEHQIHTRWVEEVLLNQINRLG